MKFAIVPSIDEQLNDRIFRDDAPEDDRSVSVYFIRGLRREIEKRGDEIHTIDMYDDPTEIDYCFLDWPRWDWIAKLNKLGLLNRTIYCNAEPVSVLPENCPEGYKKLKKIYPYILTWNSDWTDNDRIFKKNIPYPFYIDWGETAEDGYSLTHEQFANRKLATAITGDKQSTAPEELYTERRNAYIYFENHYADEFDFYGIRWNRDEHPGYKGTVDDKLNTYHGYKFAICLENTRGAQDYVTEKIYDCLCAGIIPLYGGTANIGEYVPKECFIDYFSFENYESMAAFISGMSEEEYNRYRKNIYEWLQKLDKSPYSIETYVEYLYKVVEHDASLSIDKRFKVSSGMSLYISLLGIKTRIRNLLVDIKHKTIG